MKFVKRMREKLAGQLWESKKNACHAQEMPTTTTNFLKWPV